MKLWRRIWRASVTRILLAYLAIIAISLGWSFVKHPELERDDAWPTPLPALWLAGAGVIVLAWTGANIYARVRRLEDRVKELEQR